MAAAEPEFDALQAPPPWLATLETAAVTVGTVLLGSWLRPGDPFFVRGFSWSALAPLLMGLRYGFAHGFGSALGLILMLAVAWRRDMISLTDFPAQFAVGLLVTGMVAGEFADVWTRRVRRGAVISDFRRLRLEEFARAYHLLKVSHDTLEHRVAGSTQNLREALQTLRAQLVAAKDPGKPLLGLENMIIALFSQYGWIQTAALFIASEDRQLGATAVARLGQVQTSASDPLLAMAVKSGSLVSVRPEMTPAERGTELLAAIPIIDARGRLWAVLAVREMLFVAFQADNLKLLAVLGGHVGDILAYGAGWSSADDDSGRSFHRQLERAIEDHRRFGLPAVALAMSFDTSERAAQLVKQILGARRGLDSAFTLTSRRGEPRIFLLMPFTDERGGEGYLARLRRMVNERYGTDLAAAGVTTRVRVISRGDQADRLIAELSRDADVEDQVVAHAS
jgi:hypothetical protein